MSQNIKAFVRVKPGDGERHILVQSGESVLVPRTNEAFTYEAVFGESSTNRQVFERVCFPQIEQSLSGKNICILAYGQTSTGKSHTILGDVHNPGLIPLSIERYFELLAARQLVFEMKVCYIQIYMENIKDLLSCKKADIKNGQLVGVQFKQVHSVADALEAFYVGEANRKIAKTGVNQTSSRSHAVFRIMLEGRSLLKQSFKVESEISLVDLAGSEAVSKTGAEGIVKREGEAINKSLLALSNVIRKLSERDKFINFRDSKLTKLLKSCLDGRSQTSIICTISTAENNLSETLNTLKFGLNAGAIRFSSPALEEEEHQENSMEEKERQDPALAQLAQELTRKVAAAGEENEQLRRRLEESQQLRNRQEQMCRHYQMKLLAQEENRAELSRRVRELTQMLKSVKPSRKSEQTDKMAEQLRQLTERLSLSQARNQELEALLTKRKEQPQQNKCINLSNIEEQKPDKVRKTPLLVRQLQSLSSYSLLEAQLTRYKRLYLQKVAEKQSVERSLTDLRVEGLRKGDQKGSKKQQWESEVLRLNRRVAELKAVIQNFSRQIA